MTYIRVTAFNFPREFDNNESGRNKAFEAIKELTKDEFLAIEVESWCELATVGEVYEVEMFTVEIFADETD